MGFDIVTSIPTPMKIFGIATLIVLALPVLYGLLRGRDDNDIEG